MTDCTDELLLRVRAATFEHLATDDMTGGESPDWTFRVEPDGVSRVAVPPDGTWGDTMERLRDALVAKLGGGHLADVLVDPSKPGGPRRKAFVIEGAYVPPAAPAALADVTGEAGLMDGTPSPMPTSKP